MDWAKVILETFNNSFSTILKLTYIVIPLLIVIECLKDVGWLEKISSRCLRATKLLKLPGESAIGLVVGLVVGLVFGSGVILQMREEVKMTKHQMNTMFTFIGICHSVIEETVIFTVIGAYGGILVTTRFLAALFFSLAYIWVVKCIGLYFNRTSSQFSS